MEAYIARKDGKIARIELPEGGDDVWKDIETTYPRSYDEIDQDMLLLGPCDQDASFSPDEDEALASWISERTGSVTSYKRVRSGGRSLVIYVKDECDEIGATYGDWLEVTIRKANNRK